jgi:uncharacterized protein GlcG (DUF336 family)
MNTLGRLVTGLLAALLWTAAVASAETGSPVLSLALNRPAYAPGDTLALTLINDTGTGGTGDLYVAVQSPQGSIYAFDGAGWRLFFDGARPPAAGLAPFRARTAVAVSSDTLLSLSLPSPLAAGIFTVFAFVVKAGGDPLDPNQWLSNLAQTSFGVADATADGSAAFLTADDVRAIVGQAAKSVAATTLVIAVTDRGGNVLGVFGKPGAPGQVRGNFGALVDANELAVSLARTGAFFSNDQAPLSSRTVRYISGIHFPPGIRNKPNAALYGIENTNRGCSLNTLFNPGKAIVPARALNGLPCHGFDVQGCGLGIATGKADVLDSDPSAVNGGGIPIFKDGRLVGGIGVSGVDPATAEFAAFVGSRPDSDAAVPRFGPRPAEPGVIVLDGIQLPFVVANPPAAGGGAFVGSWVVDPRDSPFGAAGVPDGWLVGPLGSAELTVAEVERIVLQSIDTANRARAAIRLPLGSRSRMMIAVADLHGAILGLYRMPDTTIFSIDVSVAKARNMAFFAGPNRAAGDLSEVPMATAVTARTIGFGAQPLYPPGIDGTEPGPFFPLFLNDLSRPCGQGSQPPDLDASGIVFFPGSLPLYKNGRLVGGLGISGDGVEQDDLIAAGGATGYVPDEAIRADQLVVRGVRLPFLKFPRNPFAP